MTDNTFETHTGAGTIAGSASGAVGDGPALLLLDGGPGFSDYMDMLGPEVTGWQAIRYQQRGLAPSSARRARCRSVRGSRPRP